MSKRQARKAQRGRAESQSSACEGLTRTAGQLQGAGGGQRGTGVRFEYQKVGNKLAMRQETITKVLRQKGFLPAKMACGFRQIT